MNMKTTKFLAVLAVLAMAFAAFAVVVPAEEQEATATGDMPVQTDVTAADIAAITIGADGKGTIATSGYVDLSKSTVDNEITYSGTDAAAIYIIPGEKNVTIKSSGNSTNDLTIYIAKEVPSSGSGKVTYYCNLGVALTMTSAATDSATLTLSFDSTKGPSAKMTGLTGFTVDAASACGALHFVDNADNTKDVYNLYAQGTTVSGTISLSYTVDGTLADSVIVRNATVSVSQKIGTETNKISFTGNVDADGGLKVTAAAAETDIDGCTMDDDNAAITINTGSFKVTTTAITYASLDKFNLNAVVTGSFSNTSINVSSYLRASGYEATDVAAHPFGTADVTIVGMTGAKTIYAVNSTGTITLKGGVGVSSLKLTGVTMPMIYTADTNTVTLNKETNYGDFTTGSFELIQGTFEFGTATKTVAYGKTLQVDSGATLKLADGATLQVTGSMYVAGEVTGTTIVGAEIKVINSTETGETDKAVFKMRSEGTLTYIAFTTDSNGVIDLDAAMKTVEMGGILESATDLVYGPTQKIYITSDLTITKGITVTIRGELEIPAGTKIIIEKGSNLVINGITADADIYGGVLIENGDFIITNSKAVNVYGGIESRENGTLAPASNLTFKTGSYSDLNGAFTITGEKTKVDAGAILSINGNFSGKLKNAGNVVLDGAKITADNTTITMTATDAIVDIEKVTIATVGHKLVITDAGIKATASGKEGTAANANTINITSDTLNYGISGLEIKEKATGSYSSKTGITTVTNKMYLSGAVEKVIATGSIVDTPTATVELAGYVADAKNSFVISDELEIGKKINFTMNAAVSISGDLTVNDGGVLTAVTADNGKISVSGSISMYDDQVAKIEAVLNGVAFKADTHEYVVTTLTDAAAFVATCEGNVTVKVYGTNYVTEETYITKNMRVSNGSNTPSIIVGSATLNTVKMTVISGASVATDITVYGILTAEVAKNITGKVTADVKVTDGESATWTSLANALATAEPGDVIEITNPTLAIASNMTIPELVTVYIPDGTTASIAKEKTLTVDGILLADAKVTLGEDAKLVVNGVARFTEASVGAAYTAYGSDAAYYMNDGYAYITNFAYAATDDAKDVYIFGTVKESESCVAEAKAIHIGNADVAGVLSVSDLGLADGAYVMVGTNAKSELNGIISGVNDDEETVGTVALSEYKGLVSCTYNIADDYYTFGINAITGTVSITEGIVTLLNDVAKATTLNVAADAILMIPKGIDLTLSKGVLAGLVTVQGTLTINDDDVDLLGSIIVAYDKDESIKGVLTVSAITMEAGSIVVVDGAEFDVTGNLTIGNPATSLNAAPVIIGAVTLGSDNFMIVYADADVDEMVINPNSDGMSTAKTTTFFINDMEYMTIYASATTNVKYNDVLKDLKFQIEELEPTQLAKLVDASAWGLTNATIGTDLLAYAELDYAKVTIQASWVKGLSLYVDGVRISTPGALKLSVGVHLVSATVDAGYACDNMGITFNGVAVTPAGIYVEVDDTGSVLAVTGDVYIPEPEPVTPEEKSEWTITTILLVVLVILIAIMAVIVALRLNRS